MSTNLPPEIWLKIFNSASPALEGFSASYIPFEDSRFDANYIERARTRRNLGLVCRQWHALFIESVFTELNVHPDAHRILNRLIGDGSGGGGYGELVRLVLPYDMTYTPRINERDYLRPSLRIIRSCHNISVLIRPSLLTNSIRALQFFARSDGGIHPGDLSSLKRLEWTHYSETVMSGGINSIHSVLESSPSLQFLSFGGDFGFLDVLRIPTLTIPALKTLRVHRTNDYGIAQICFWSLPALHTVILAGASPTLHAVLYNFGAQITTLELGNDMSFFSDREVLKWCLKCCPALQTFNYPIFFTHPPRMPAPQGELEKFADIFTGSNVITSSVTCMGLHPQRPTVADGRGDACNYEQHLDSHIGWFMDKRWLPDLKHVRLYGDWADAPTSSQFKELARSISVEFVDRPEQGKDW